MRIGLHGVVVRPLVRALLPWSCVVAGLCACAPIKVVAIAHCETPSPERCNDETDNDCDGLVDEPDCDLPEDTQTERCGNGLNEDEAFIDEGCFCHVGEIGTCYEGAVETRNVGRCQDGQRECGDGTTLDVPVSQWLADQDCVGQVLATDEVCDGTEDEDCDGAVDEDCNCEPGAARACLEGIRPPCQPGEQRCLPNGAWSSCEGALTAEPERCDDGVDNDCNGRIDDGCRCVSRPEICDDDVDNDCDGRVDEVLCGDPAAAVACSPRTFASPCPDQAFSRPSLDVTQINTTAFDPDRLSGSCGGAGAGEFVRAFQAIEGTWHFDTAGSTYDTVIYVLEGSCQGSEIACVNDRAGSPLAALTVTFEEPTPVVVVIDGADASQCGVLVLTTTPL